ncbi:hypothetical protein [Leisingera sp. ANG-S5]|uniref:hypothetical protein n=1 Tax=Leisingera sp. ANG-S5 TaxID=1577901 RepID=UPI001F4C90B6|nr:hypothetical protein [Leisingera sp. ANG-S5]
MHDAWHGAKAPPKNGGHMGSETQGAEAPVLILTNNAFEAVDISDYLTRRGLNAILTESKVEHCTGFLEDGLPPPRLVFFAFPLSNSAARDWLTDALSKKWRVILVNGDTAEPELKALPMLTRPFKTAHLDAVMEMVGE